MRIADIIQDSIVDGSGLRFVVFTQGCPHGCAGCHNPGTWDPNGGREMPVEEILKAMLSNPLTDGLTLTGGEPFFQAADCAAIASAARRNGLNVWGYSGYGFEELMELSHSDPGTAELLNLLDVLVDGRFIMEQRSLNLKWRGSANQRLIDVQKSLAEGGPVLYEP